ncbi:AAA family ATPase [Acidovorax temperans]|uniref:AAA family ATPase n=1 Tax=Acidovorax temperans TaxID=80878 RepID=UPI0030CB6045
MKSNPWIASYLVGDSPSRYSHLEFRAKAQRIQGDSVAARAEVLRCAMGDVFLCGEQISLLLDKLLGIGEAHAISHYSPSRPAIQPMYSLRPWGETTQPAVMLTGLAGTGKTQLLQAMKRFFCDRVGTADLPAHRNLPVLPAWFMSLKDGTTLNTLLGPCVFPTDADVEVEVKKEKSPNQSQLLQIASRVSRRDGTCIIFLDEFQFISSGTDANARAMNLLLQMIGIGPRVVYVANFSLARRLKKRRPEERHRVLTNHLELLPDELDSSDFGAYIYELTQIVPDDFRFDVVEIAGLIHRYSFGIKRAVVELMVGAWAHAKTRRGERADVAESDVRAAYASSAYTSHRSDVEALWRHSVGDRSIDPDLLNPLHVDNLAGTVVVAQAAIDNFNQRVNERHVEGMLTPSERDVLSKLSPQKKTTVAGGTLRPLRKGAGSKDSLLSAFDRVAKDL